MASKQDRHLLTIGEVASRLGLSIRALRLYESEGLLRPARSEAGRRAFAAADLARLQHVLVLKKAGCTLAQIRTLLAARTPDFAALIDLQIGALDRQRATIDLTLASLRAARTRLADGQAIALAEFCDLVKQGEYKMTEDAWNQVYEKYYTPEEMERFRTAKAELGDAAITDVQRAWSDLIARVQAAMDSGAGTDSHAAMSLAREWYDLQKPLMEAVGVETWNKGATMYEQMQSWQTDTLRAPFSPALYRFIGLAAEAARAHGLIPPRAAAA